jgi:hypothetical protein
LLIAFKYAKDTKLLLLVQYIDSPNPGAIRHVHLVLGRPPWHFSTAPGTVCKLSIDPNPEVVSDRSDGKTGGAGTDSAKPDKDEPHAGMETQ